MVIYKITNLLSEKIYIGQTKQKIEQRFLQHSKANSPLGQAMRQCGLENFTVEVIENCKTQAELNEREKFWIKILNSKSPNGYNQTNGGGGFQKIINLSEKQSDIYAREIKNICRLTIQDALLVNGYTIFKLEQNQKIGNREWDLIIKTNAFDDDGIKNWCIEIKSGFEVDRFLAELFSSLYLYSDSEERNKISLVIVDAKAFYVIRNQYKDVEIVDDVSVILVDRMKFKISGEFYFKKKGETVRKKSTLV